MSSENNSAAAATTQPTAGAAKPRLNAVQDSAVADEITADGQTIAKALDDSEIVALLTPRGYDEAELQVGLALKDAAQAAYNARQAALGVETEAKTVRDAARTAAEAEYVDYRLTVQAKYPDAATRRALGASGRLPPDLQKFVTQATGAYDAALKPPYAAALAKRSFTAARLAAAAAGLQTLATLDNKLAKAEGEAGGTFDQRETATTGLRAWMREFRASAKLALKKYPAHRATLGL